MTMKVRNARFNEAINKSPNAMNAVRLGPNEITSQANSQIIVWLQPAGPALVPVVSENV